MPGLGHKAGSGEDFDVMGQGGSGHANAVAQRADAQAVWSCAHKGAQNRQTLFGAKGGKSAGGAREFKRGMRFHFHISRFIEI